MRLFIISGFIALSISTSVQAAFTLINNTTKAYYIKAYSAPRELTKKALQSELILNKEPQKNRPVMCILEQNQQVTVGVVKPIIFFTLYAYDQTLHKKAQKLYIVTIKPSNHFDTLHMSTLQKIANNKLPSDLVHVVQCVYPEPDWNYSLAHIPKDKEPAMTTLAAPIAHTYKILSSKLASLYAYVQQQRNLQHAVHSYYFAKRQPQPTLEFTVPLFDILEKGKPTESQVYWYWHTVHNKPADQAQELTIQTYPLFAKLYTQVSDLNQKRADLIPSGLEHSKINTYFDKLDKLVGTDLWRDYYYTQDRPFTTTRFALDNLADKLRYYAQANT